SFRPRIVLSRRSAMARNLLRSPPRWAERHMVGRGRTWLNRGMGRRSLRRAAALVVLGATACALVPTPAAADPAPPGDGDTRLTFLATGDYIGQNGTRTWTEDD